METRWCCCRGRRVPNLDVVAEVTKRSRLWAAEAQTYSPTRRAGVGVAADVKLHRPRAGCQPSQPPSLSAGTLTTT